jgi:hypothetical protein
MCEAVAIASESTVADLELGSTWAAHLGGELTCTRWSSLGSGMPADYMLNSLTNLIKTLFAHGLFFFICFVEFDLLIFYLGTLHLFSTMKMASSFYFTLLYS